MNKAELATEVAKKTKLSQKVAKVVVDSVFDEMVKALKTGDRVEIRGFGSFVIRNYGSYQGRNPKTGVTVSVLPKKLPYFKVGKELKERVDLKKESTPEPEQE
ncbi:MAG: integration host factor subunit beta [Desulfobacterales bacterium]|nr:integration host factor subunit beta [Desulfobacterales bacterium]